MRKREPPHARSVDQQLPHAVLAQHDRALEPRRQSAARRAPRAPRAARPRARGRGRAAGARGSRAVDPRTPTASSAASGRATAWGWVTKRRNSCTAGHGERPRRVAVDELLEHARGARVLGRVAVHREREHAGVDRDHRAHRVRQSIVLARRARRHRATDAVARDRRGTGRGRRRASSTRARRAGPTARSPRRSARSTTSVSVRPSRRRAAELGVERSDRGQASFVSYAKAYHYDHAESASDCFPCCAWRRAHPSQCHHPTRSTISPDRLVYDEEPTCHADKSQRDGNGAANGHAVAGHVKDMKLAREGRHADRVGRPQHAGAARDPRALREGAPAARHAHRAPASTSPPRPRTSRARSRRAAPRCSCAARTRSARRTTSPPRWSPTTGSPTYAIKGEDHKTYYSHIVSCIEAQPAHHDGRRLRPRHRAAHQEEALPARRDRRHRGDLDRRHAPARDGGEQGARATR